LLECARGAAASVKIAQAEHARRLSALARMAAGRYVAGSCAIQVCANALRISHKTLRAFGMIAAGRAPAQGLEETSSAPSGVHRSADPGTPQDGPASEPTALARVADQIVTHLAEARRGEAKARFAIGDEIHTIRHAATMLPRAVGRLAARLAIDESGLQRIARVAERIRPAERDALLSLTDGRGLPLTWSHLEQLQFVTGVEARLAFAREVLAAGLSVDELRRRLRGLKRVGAAACGA
jgi:hypothetical protein